MLHCSVRFVVQHHRQRSPGGQVLVEGAIRPAVRIFEITGQRVPQHDGVAILLEVLRGGGVEQMSTDRAAAPFGRNSRAGSA